MTEDSLGQRLPAETSDTAHELELLAQELDISPAQLTRLADIVARMVAERANGTEADIKPEGENAAIIAELTTNPRIYYLLDYWSRSGGGHGVKYRRGQPTTETIEKDMNRDATWTRALKELNLFSGSWHYGEGIVGRVHAQASTYFILSFQTPHAEYDARPDVRLYVCFPSTPEFESTISAINADPTILLQVFPLVCPPETKKFVEDIRLVTPHVIDLDGAAAQSA